MDHVEGIQVNLGLSTAAPVLALTGISILKVWISWGPLALCSFDFIIPANDQFFENWLPNTKVPHEAQANAMDCLQYAPQRHQHTGPWLQLVGIAG